MSFLSEPISIIPIRPVRKIGSISVNVVINENTTDTLTITKQPVQQGASITDHAYKEPTSFSTSILLKDNSFNLSTALGDKGAGLSKIYQDLLELQISRVPFAIITPKRIYKNMLMGTLSQITDKNTENCLAINASFQEVIIVKVSTTSVPRKNQKNAAATGKTEKAGKKNSAITNFVQAFRGGA